MHLRSPVGDADFVAAFSALPLTSWRIVNEPDIVPTQPPELAGFGHIGVEQKFDSSACPYRKSNPGILMMQSAVPVANQIRIYW
jgi:hypothetical protein